MGKLKKVLIVLIVLVYAFILIPDIIFARSTNAFLVGEKVKSRKTLTLNKRDIYGKTLGKPSQKAVSKAGGDPDKYLKMRGNNSVAGKAFEARSGIRVNNFLKRTNSKYRILITSVEGLPNDVSDLIRIDAETRKVSMRYQLKFGWRAAKAAINNPRYAEMSIVTPPDALKIIKKELAKRKYKAAFSGRLLDTNWRKLEQAVDNGVLTDRIMGQTVPVTRAIKKTANAYARSEINAMSKAMLELSDSQGLRGGETKLIKGVSRLFMIKNSRITKIAGGASVLTAGIADIVIGVDSIDKNTHRIYAGSLDADVYYMKQGVAGTQITLGVVGVADGAIALSAALGLLTAPELIVTKVAGVVVIVGSVGLMAADYVLEGVQENRVKYRISLLRQIDEKERQKTIIEQLQKEITISANPPIRL
jgi:hypothetical protein